MTIFEDEIVNNNAFKHANLIVTELWALTNEIMLNIMQNFKSTYVLSSISETLYNFSTGFFPMYRGILKLKITLLAFSAKMARYQIRRVATWLNCFDWARSAIAPRNMAPSLEYA